MKALRLRLASFFMFFSVSAQATFISFQDFRTFSNSFDSYFHVSKTSSLHSHRFRADTVKYSKCSLQTFTGLTLCGPQNREYNRIHHRNLRPTPKTVAFASESEEGLSDDSILTPQGDWREARAKYVSLTNKCHIEALHTAIQINSLSIPNSVLGAGCSICTPPRRPTRRWAAASITRRLPSPPPTASGRTACSLRSAAACCSPAPRSAPTRSSGDARPSAPHFCAPARSAPARRHASRYAETRTPRARHACAALAPLECAPPRPTPHLAARARARLNARIYARVCTTLRVRTRTHECTNARICMNARIRAHASMHEHARKRANARVHARSKFSNTSARAKADARAMDGRMYARTHDCTAARKRARAYERAKTRARAFVRGRARTHDRPHERTKPARAGARTRVFARMCKYLHGFARARARRHDRPHQRTKPARAGQARGRPTPVTRKTGGSGAYECTSTSGTGPRPSCGSSACRRRPTRGPRDPDARAA